MFILMPFEDITNDKPDNYSDNYGRPVNFRFSVNA
jgi:hypothetical protein